jgi:hypothetical protein
MATKKGKRLPKALKPNLSPEALAMVEMLNDPKERSYALDALSTMVYSAMEKNDHDLVGGAFRIFGEALWRGYELPPEILRACGFALRAAMRTEDGQKSVTETFGKRGNKPSAEVRSRNVEIWLKFCNDRAKKVSYTDSVSSLAKEFHLSTEAIRSIIDAKTSEEKRRQELIRMPI